MSERRHETVFPGFAQLAARRRALSDELASRRRALGLSQTEVAARMGTSQSAVARLESGAGDVRLSTVERYAAALGWQLDWRLQDGVG
ncbi:MAG: helix-turn-helix domain-containing protein [Acidimicrobiales bacterium]